MTATDNAESLPGAGLLRRLAAMIYDTFLVIPLAMAVTATHIGLKSWLYGLTPGQPALTGIGYWLNLLIVAAAVVLFFTGFWTRAGRTLGMQAWRLRIDSTDGARISTRQALIRLAGALASAACFGIGYLWIVFDRERRSWHDIASGSRVVVLPKAGKAM